MNVGKSDYKFLPLFIGSHVTIANCIIQIQNQVEKVQIALDSLKKPNIQLIQNQVEKVQIALDSLKKPNIQLFLAL